MVPGLWMCFCLLVSCTVEACCSLQPFALLCRLFIADMVCCTRVLPGRECFKCNEGTLSELLLSTGLTHVDASPVVLISTTGSVHASVAHGFRQLGCCHALAAESVPGVLGHICLTFREQSLQLMRGNMECVGVH